MFIPLHSIPDKFRYRWQKSSSSNKSAKSSKSVEGNDTKNDDDDKKDNNKKSNSPRTSRRYSYPKSRRDSRNNRLPISSTFYISEESLVPTHSHDGSERSRPRTRTHNDPREYFRNRFPSPPWSETRSERRARGMRLQSSDEESLAGNDANGVIKYPLPGPWSPHHAESRKLWIKMFVAMFLMLVGTIMGTMSIYWGADHSLQFNIPVLTVAIVDFDRQEVGPYLWDMADAERRKDYKNALGFVSEEEGKYTNVDEVYDALHDQHFWFVVIISANATAAMNNAYSAGDDAYDPRDAVQVVYEEARNALVIGEVLHPKLMAFMDEFVLSFTQQKQKTLMESNTGSASDVDALVRQVETPIPISYTVMNRAPATPTTAEAATEIGTIYLIIVSFLSVLMFDKLSDTIMGHIPTPTYYIYRMAVLPFVYFFLSLFYLCLSCAWHISFSKHYGPSGYVIYWMLSWISMMAFGLCIENVNNILGMPFTPVFFVFWVISNVTTGFYPTEMESNFYKWGIVWPLRHDMMGARSIIYGTKNTLRENFGVLLGWVVISLLLQPGTVWVQLRKKKKALEEKRRAVLVRVWGEPGREKGGSLKMPRLN